MGLGKTKDLQQQRLISFGLATDFAQQISIAPADVICIEMGLLDHVPAKALLAYAKALGISPDEIPEKKKTYMSDLMSIGCDLKVLPNVSQEQRYEMLVTFCQDHMHDRRTVELVAHKLGLR